VLPFLQRNRNIAICPPPTIVAGRQRRPRTFPPLQSTRARCRASCGDMLLTGQRLAPQRAWLRRWLRPTRPAREPAGAGAVGAWTRAVGLGCELVRSECEVRVRTGVRSTWNFCQIQFLKKENLNINKSTQKITPFVRNHSSP
jgi:hypothetical protein